MQSDVDEDRTRKIEVRPFPLPASMRPEDVDLRRLISHSIAVQIGETTESVFDSPRARPNLWLSSIGNGWWVSALAIASVSC